MSSEESKKLFKMEDNDEFNIIMSKDKEEEKEYLFNDPDEEKITFNNYRRGLETDFGMFEEQEENCSECDKDKKSKIMADLPTNDSNNNIFEMEEEEQEATKFLTRMGLLEKVENEDLFLLNDMDSSLLIQSRDDFELESFSIREQNLKSESLIDDEVRMSIYDEGIDLDFKHKELMKEGLPFLDIDEGFELMNIDSSNPSTLHRGFSVISQKNTLIK